jgi:spermidine synthase
MTQWAELARARMPDGGELLLRQCDGVFEIRCNGWELMSNRAPRSEQAMARLACAGLPAAPRVLIGGLGMGFSLRATLDALPVAACVIVAESVPEVIDWNRGPLAPLAGCPLDDTRVVVHCADALDVLAGPGGFNAVLLDIDNGPTAPIYRRPPRLYQRDGLMLVRNSLMADGVLAVWSADNSKEFETALVDCGFAWRGVEVSAREGDAGPWHTIYLARPNAAMAKRRRATRRSDSLPGRIYPRLPRPVPGTRARQRTPC